MDRGGREAECGDDALLASSSAQCDAALLDGCAARGSYLLLLRFDGCVGVHPPDSRQARTEA